jgi:hypothetical protein
MAGKDTTIEPLYRLSCPGYVVVVVVVVVVVPFLSSVALSKNVANLVKLNFKKCNEA